MTGAAGRPRASGVAGRPGRLEQPGRVARWLAAARRAAAWLAAGALAAGGLAGTGAAPRAALAAGPAPPTASLSLAGTRAFDMARSADDGAGLALEEGEKALAQVKALAPGDRAPEALKPLLAEAAEAHEALAGYRRQAQASAGEALQTLVEVSRVAAQSTPDPIRRDALEQQALLAAHEAAVMSARARAEAERLRAVLAEARAAVGSAGKAPARAQAGARPSAGPVQSGIAVPNLIGSRLEAATRDLAAAGLRLGAATGPRAGFVVKQAPDPGARVAPRSPVSVTLSATAATTTVVTPR